MRIFKSIAGYTVTDYIRRRRLTEAAKVLLNTDMKIIDIAMMHGYNSQEAFSRAFKEMFNVTPNYYRTNKISYKNLEQLVLNENLLNLKAGGRIVEPKIIERDSFIIAGLEYKFERQRARQLPLPNSSRDQQLISGRSLRPSDKPA